jgi:hypothetical protein
MYADDTTLAVGHKDPQLLQLKLDNSLKLMENWFRENKLSVNIEKTRFIQFCRT